MTNQEAEAEVRRKHQRFHGDGDTSWCRWEGQSWPCPVIQSLDAAIARAEAAELKAQVHAVLFEQTEAMMHAERTRAEAAEAQVAALSGALEEIARGYRLESVDFAGAMDAGNKAADRAAKALMALTADVQALVALRKADDAVVAAGERLIDANQAVGALVHDVIFLRLAVAERRALRQRQQEGGAP